MAHRNRVTRSIQNLDNQRSEIDRIFSLYNIQQVSQQEALTILEQLKTAVINNDSEVINEVCTVLKQKTANTSFEPIVQSTCDTLFKDMQCTSAVINFTSPNGNSSPSDYINLVNNKIGSCKHAFIYVDSDFEGFDDEEVNFISKLGIADVDIINPSNNHTVYSGPLDSNINTKGDEESKSGWMILVGVIIFIAMGLVVGHAMLK